MRTQKSLTLTLSLAILAIPPSAALAASPVLPGTPAAHEIAEAQARGLLKRLAADVATAHRGVELASPYGRIHVLWRGYALMTLYSEPLCAAVNVQSAGEDGSPRSGVTAICVGLAGSDTYTVIYRQSDSMKGARR